MKTLIELRDFLSDIGLPAEVVDAILAKAQEMIDGKVRMIRSILEDADPEDTTPCPFCDCGGSNYHHFQKFFGTPEAEKEFRAGVEEDAVMEVKVATMMALYERAAAFSFA